MKNNLETIRGCLLGGAVGDALGSPIEFMDLNEIRSKFGPAGLTGYSPSYGRLGAITDDTQMTLWTAEGLMRGKTRYDERGICNAVNVIHHAYRRWLYTQQNLPMNLDPNEKDWLFNGWLLSQNVLHSRRGPGNTCLSALRSGKMGGIDTSINNSKGSGGVMRAAPIGLVDFDCFKIGAEAAATTHGHPSGYLSAGAFAQIINGSRKGLPVAKAAETAMTELKKWQGHEETLRAIEKALDLAESAPRTPETVELLGGGWIGEEALSIALFCAIKAKDFKSGVLLAVNHGGDSDTTGSMTGSLLGTLLGAKAIPKGFLKHLEARELIEEIAADFEKCFFYKDETWHEKYPPN